MHTLPKTKALRDNYALFMITRKPGILSRLAKLYRTNFDQVIRFSTTIPTSKISSLIYIYICYFNFIMAITAMRIMMPFIRTTVRNIANRFPRYNNCIELFSRSRQNSVVLSCRLLSFYMHAVGILCLLYI